MKNLTITISTLLFTVNSYGQTNPCENLKKEISSLKIDINKLKQDTAFLNKEIQMCKWFNAPKEYQVKSFNPMFDVEIISCIGDRINQTVKIEFIISHKSVHQEVCINMGEEQSKAYDALGNKFNTKQVSLSGLNVDYDNGYTCTKIPTEVPVKGYIILRNIMPGTDLLKFVNVLFGCRNFDGGGQYTMGNLEVKNLKINW